MVYRARRQNSNLYKSWHTKYQLPGGWLRLICNNHPQVLFGALMIHELVGASEGLKLTEKKDSHKNIL